MIRKLTTVAAMFIAILFTWGCEIDDSGGPYHLTIHVRIMDADGSNQELLHNIRSWPLSFVKLTPDEQNLSYIYGYTMNLERYSIADETTYEYDLPLETDFEFDVTNDWVYLQGKANDNYDVYRVPMDGGASTNLTQIAATDKVEYFVSPSGEWLIYPVKQDTMHHIMQMNLSTLEQTSVISDSLLSYRWPQISPDLSSIFYFHYSDQDSTDGFYRLDLATLETTKLFNQVYTSSYSIDNSVRYIIFGSKLYDVFLGGSPYHFANMSYPQFLFNSTHFIFHESSYDTIVNGDAETGLQDSLGMGGQFPYVSKPSNKVVFWYEVYSSNKGVTQ